MCINEVPTCSPPHTTSLLITSWRLPQRLDEFRSADSNMLRYRYSDWSRPKGWSAAWLKAHSESVQTPDSPSESHLFTLYASYSQTRTDHMTSKLHTHTHTHRSMLQDTCQGSRRQHLANIRAFLQTSPTAKRLFKHAMAKCPFRLIKFFSYEGIICRQKRTCKSSIETVQSERNMTTISESLSVVPNMSEIILKYFWQNIWTISIFSNIFRGKKTEMRENKVKIAKKKRCSSILGSWKLKTTSF